MNDLSPDRASLLADERRRLPARPHGRLRVAVGYPNSYRVAHSSLAYQWLVELSGREPDVGVERFVADPGLAAVSLETGAALGGFDVLAFTCSFELDAVNLLAALDAAGIPRRRSGRGSVHPLVVMGGPVAAINPLPLAPAVDVFCLGAAERMWPELLRLAQECTRERLLEELATRDGFFVPRHHLDARGRPLGRVRRLEKRDEHMADPALVPGSHLVTPNSHYENRGLVEISRGCPEKCRYCWISFTTGRLRCYPTDAILARLDDLRAVTDRVGLVATAVGDHPELARILEQCREWSLDVAVSSLRIPAMVSEVLAPLAASGAQSVTIAPETGSDALRRRLSKPIPNSRILEAAETAQRCGMPSLKMYFIVGLPGETDDDVRAIAGLLRDAQEILVAHGRARGRVGTLHAGVSVLVPKPYTPYRDQAMLTRAEFRRRFTLLERALRGLANFKLDRPSYREAQWQAYLSRAGVEAFELLGRLADGTPLAHLLRDQRAEIERHTTEGPAADAPEPFITSAPVTPPAPLDTIHAG